MSDSGISYMFGQQVASLVFDSNKFDHKVAPLAVVTNLATIALDFFIGIISIKVSWYFWVGIFMIIQSQLSLQKVCFPLTQAMTHDQNPGNR